MPRPSTTVTSSPITETRPARLPRFTASTDQNRCIIAAPFRALRNTSRADSAVHSTRPGAARECWRSGRAGCSAGADGVRVETGDPGVRARARCRPRPTRNASRAGRRDRRRRDHDGYRHGSGGRGDRAGARPPSIVDFVMVVGIAGGVGDAVKVGDVLRAERRRRRSERQRVSTRRSLPASSRRGRLVSSDDFHVEDDELVELEAAGVDRARHGDGVRSRPCARRDGCSWSVVRSISDMANDHPIGDAVDELAKPDGSREHAGRS